MHGMLKSNSQNRDNFVSNTFGGRAVRFFASLQAPSNLPHGVSTVCPYDNPEMRKVMCDFYRTFFNDNHKRVFVLGINPGRFGSGVTGVPFTDPVALEEVCGIMNGFEKKRELSSRFVYAFIEAFGGAKKFYDDFFVSAVSPVGFVRNGKNYNYYDDARLYTMARPFIVDTLKEQVSFGAHRTVILLGAGKNASCFNELNATYHLFDTVLTVEHPRYIMQYQRKQLDTYIKKYIDVFSRALELSAR